MTNEIREFGNQAELDSAEEAPPPVYNLDLDPDNAVSPLEFDARIAEGKNKFYPEIDVTSEIAYE